MASKNTRRRAKSKTRLSKTSKQRAGRIVFSGTYGCAFRPAIKCKDESTRRPGMISKLIKSSDAYGEMKLKRVFEPIDPDQDFFYYPEHECDPDLTPNEEDNFADCDVANVSNMSNENAVLLLSQDGGDDLAHIRLDPADYAAFFESLLTVFEGLILIHKKGHVHLDIKPSNIVSKKMPDGSFKTRIIDLGLSEEIAIISKYPHVVNYTYWPYDFRLLERETRDAGLPDFTNDEKKYFEGDIKDFYTHLTYSRPLYPDWTHVTPSGSKIDTSWVHRIIEKINSEEISEKQIVTGVDVFGLGRTISEVYARLTGHLYIKDKESDDPEKGVVIPRSVNIGNVDELSAYHTELAKKLSRPLYHLVKRMTNPNPENRPSSAEAGMAYRRLIPAMKSLFKNFPALKRLQAIPDPGEPAVTRVVKPRKKKDADTGPPAMTMVLRPRKKKEPVEALV